MTEQRPHILVIEDDVDLLESYVIELEETDEFEVASAQTIREAREKLGASVFDVILTDMKLQAAIEGGMEILSEVKSSQPDTQVIIFTGIGGTDDARQALRLQADGFMSKPLDFDNVRQVIRNCVLVRQQRIELRKKREGRRSRGSEKIHFPTPDQFIYACTSMRELINQAARLASTDQNIFIVGEPGTGKGLIAEGIHFGSGRSHFELVNCGSLSERSLERIIFGWVDESGSYASGLLERLQGGTLVLDRVSGLSLRLQEKLLTALVAGEYQPDDSLPAFPVNLRLISLDETDLDFEVQQGLFLADLRDALVHEKLAVPALRTRQDDKFKDVLLLTEHYIKKHAQSQENDAYPRLAPEVEYIFETYPFPGNVGELEKAIQLALSQTTDQAIRSEHLPVRMKRYSIRPGLGQVEDDQLRVLCPHGNVYCNQTQVIAHAYRNVMGLYVRLNLYGEIAKDVEKLAKQFGMNVFPPEQIDNALMPMCDVCVPIQSSRYAILDLSETSGKVFYEIGLLHSMGVTTLLLSKSGVMLPDFFNTTQIMEYHDAEDLLHAVENWLREIISYT